jgi:hypothetical protein
MNGQIAGIGNAEAEKQRYLSAQTGIFGAITQPKVNNQIFIVGA